jgi:hypothetical protein
MRTLPRSGTTSRDLASIEWGSTTARGEYKSGSGGYATLADAMRDVEQQVAGLKWTDENST